MVCKCTLLLPSPNCVTGLRLNGEGYNEWNRRRIAEGWTSLLMASCMSPYYEHVRAQYPHQTLLTCASCKNTQSYDPDAFTPVMVGEPDENGMCETELWCRWCVGKQGHQEPEVE